MNGPLVLGIAAAASELGKSRSERASHVAQIIRDRRAYTWVAIFDIDENDAALLLGASGNGPSGPHVSIPVLAPESGTLMGTLDVETIGLGRDDEAFLDDCVSAMIPLFE